MNTSPLTGHRYLAPYRFEENAIPDVGTWSRGANLRRPDIDGRSYPTPPRSEMFAAEWDPQKQRWVCRSMAQLSGQPVNAWALYLGSNGVWRRNKPGNRLSPCGKRLRWDVRDDIYDWVRNPPAQRPPGVDRAAWWFFQNPRYNAQTFLAASYGLAQIGYATTARNLRWREGNPGARGWAEIVEPENNIYLAARWLATRRFRSKDYFQWVRDWEEFARWNEVLFADLIRLTLCGYNGGAEWTCDYAADVMARSTRFMPSGGSAP